MKLWAALILFTLAYAVYPLMWHGFYYQCIAFAFLFLFWHLRPYHFAARIGVWFAVNAVVDELFFDPTKISIHEYVFAIIITTFETWQVTRKKTSFGSK
jgi:hypothetical protein